MPAPDDFGGQSPGSGRKRPRGGPKRTSDGTRSWPFRTSKSSLRAVALGLSPGIGLSRRVSLRSILRRIFPDGLFGSAVDEAILARALEAGERVGGEAVRVELAAVNSSAVTASPATTTATTRWPSRSSGAPTTATSRTRGWRASTSSTSSGWMFSPPETIMSSSRPTSQRSPSSSSRPTSPVWYQPSRIGRCVGVRPVPVARRTPRPRTCGRGSRRSRRGAGARSAHGRPAHPGFAAWSRWIENV